MPHPYLCVAQTVFLISHPPPYLTHFSPGDRQSFDRNGILKQSSLPRNQWALPCYVMGSLAVAAPWMDIKSLRTVHLHLVTYHLKLSRNINA